MAFSVLFVCTGNICRSPAAERLFRARLVPANDVSVSSAGVQGLVGEPMDEPSAQALRELGGDPNGHIARRLTDRMIIESGLILTATLDQRDTIIRTVPIAMRRTFALREYARLAQSVPDLNVPLGRHARPNTSEELAGQVGAVARQRGTTHGRTDVADDVIDPFRRSPEVARSAARTSSAAVDLVLSSLGCGPAPGGIRLP
jgi:protein-tyrosine phosphatase